MGRTLSNVFRLEKYPELRLGTITKVTFKVKLMRTVVKYVRSKGEIFFRNFILVKQHQFLMK